MLTLNKKAREEIIGHCLRSSPNEACGILAGRDSKVEKVYEMANAEASPETFLMDPKEQLKVMKEMRVLGLEMAAIYHSHVASEARPSSRDIELALYPDASYLIVSLKDRKNPSLRSFKIVEGKVKEEEVKIVDSL